MIETTTALCERLGVTEDRKGAMRRLVKAGLVVKVGRARHGETKRGGVDNLWEVDNTDPERLESLARGSRRWPGRGPGKNNRRADTKAIGVRVDLDVYRWLEAQKKATGKPLGRIAAEILAAAKP